MKASALFLVLLSLALGACPGNRPPVAQPTNPAARDRQAGPLVWHLSKSGLGFRLSNADEEADDSPSRKVTPSVVLGADDAKRIAGRLPAIKVDKDDTKDFAMRAKSIPAPRPGKTVTEQFPPPVAPPPSNVPAPGPLVVERHAPEGPVDLAPHLTMTFSQPMVAVTSIGEITKERLPITLSPEPSGKWRWLGTRTLMFQPEKRFPMATEYAVDVPPSTRSVTGQAITKPERWTFSTPPVKLTRSYPSGNSEPLDPLLYAEFDQSIDPAAMLKSIELAGGHDVVPLRLADADEVEANETVRRLSQQAEKGRWFAFRPGGKLPTATSFTVRIKAGAPSSEGPRRTTGDQNFAFSTFGPLRVRGSRCSYGRDKCTPLEPLLVEFSNPIDAKLFTKKLVSITPEIPEMKLEANGPYVYIRGRTKGRTHYDARIAGAITDVHGQTLGEEAKVSFDVGPAEPMMFGAEQPMIVLDPAAAKSYRVYTINEPGLRARVYAVTPDDWRKYVDFSNEWERPRKIAPPGRLIANRVLTPKKAPDELVGTDVDLAPALTGGFGQALVIVEPTRAMPKDVRAPELHVWVQATELGVDAIVEPDQVTGWITKLADGAPIEGATVELLGAGSKDTDKEGLARVAFTDKTGTLLVARRGKDLAIAPEQWWSRPSYVKSNRADDVRWLVFDDRGMYKPGEEVRVKGFVRRSGVGRGGDLDMIPEIAGKKVAYVARDPRGAELGKGTAAASDQGGFDFAFKLPGNANLGMANIEIDLPVGLNGTTHYHSFSIQEFRRPEFEVTARSSEGPHFVGEHAIATLSASYYSGGGLPDAPVTWNVTRSVSGYTPPNRSDFHFGPEAGFGWRHVVEDPKRQPKTETWTSHTNPQGVHRLRVDFDAVEPSYPMNLAFTGQVEDVNRQGWAGRTSMLVHPADTYVGLRLAKNFLHAGDKIDVDVILTDIDGKIVQGRTATVKAARIDVEQKGDSWEEKEVDVQTCEVASAAGGAATESRRCSMRTTQGGSWIVRAVVTDSHGRKNQTATELWVIGNESPKDRKLDRATANVVADKKEYAPGELAEVLVLSPFASASAPISGLLTVRRQGVVHIERFTMQGASQAIKVKLEDAHVPNVQIAVELASSEVRTNASGDPDPKLPRRPAYAFGSTTVTVLPTRRLLTVKATADKPTLEPGGATQLSVDVRDADGKPAASAEVAVFVADESVLALSGYKTPDPAAVFYAPRGADTREIRTRDHVLLEEPDLTAARAAAVPNMRPMKTALARRPMTESEGDADRPSFGGMPAPVMASAAPGAPPPPPMEAAEEKARKKDAPAAQGKSVTGDATTPIAMRTNFSPLALFAPRVKTDAAGHATVPVKIPDNLTRYRVMAVAARGDRAFGANESTITARLPLMVRPSAPRFANFGDKFELPVVVQNQTDAATEVGVVLRATNAIVDGASAKRVSIPPNDRAIVSFNVATTKAGTARLQIGVAAGSFADASEIELPVYTPATSEAFATYGVIDEGAMAQPVKMPPGVFPQFGGLEITTSSTQLQALTDAVLYLVKYPFECNEQIASRVISIAALRDVLAAFKTAGLPSPDVLLASMNVDFEKLKRHQHWDGGWGFWQETPYPYLTVHVTHALVRAKEKGFKPDEQMMARAQSYLRSIESHYPAWYTAEMRRAITAYALYVRKRMGDADPARAKALVAQAGGVDKLPIEAVGWIWPTIADDKNSQAENEAIRRHVANRATETAGNAHFVSGYKDGDWVLLSSDRRADGVLLEAMIGDQPQSTLIPKLVKGLLDHRKAGHWLNTQENAFALLALDRYFATYEKVTPDFVARVWLGDRFAGEHAFKGRTTERDHIAIPMSFLATEMKAPQNLLLAKDGPGRLYYRVGMEYAPTDLKLPPADNGFVVSRIYEGAEKADDVKRDADGTWRVRAGAKVRVRVSMVAQSRRYHVALVDPLPAGLEAMNPALAVTGEIPKDPKDEKARGGRYWYWSRTWYEHQNMRDERVEAFASLLWDGVWDYTYVAKATTAGVFVVPPPKAEEMYAPETFGRGSGDRMIIE